MTYNVFSGTLNPTHFTSLVNKNTISRESLVFLHCRHGVCRWYIQLDEDLIVPERAAGVRAGRPMSTSEGYQPVDFSSLPIGPDFDLVDGVFFVLNLRSVT